MTDFWQYSERATIAKLAGLSTGDLYKILRRERGVSVKRARKLESASKKVLSRPIPLIDWLTNDETGHPAFSPIK